MRLLSGSETSRAASSARPSSPIRSYDAPPDFPGCPAYAVARPAIERELRPNRRPPTEFTERCIEAAEIAGFRRKEDLNDGDLSGVLGYEWMNYEGARRRSSYVAFLADRGPRPNLRVMTRALAHRLTLDADGRVSGVLYEHDGVLARASARREVVLAAGALETPKILMLSGLGPGPVLRGVGVPVVSDLGGVGSNLHDHPNVTLFFLGKRPVDCHYPQLYGFHRANPTLDLPARQSDTCYVFYPARSSLKQAAKRMLPGLVLPDRWYGPRSRGLVRRTLDAVYATGLADPIIDRIYGIVAILGKPKSRGSVALHSTAPADNPRVDPAFFEAPEDMATMVAAVRLSRRIARAAPLTASGNRELAPGARAEQDEALATWIRGNVMTTFHFAGTCRLGEDEASVVDPRLRVRGVRGLRVVDASVIPVAPVSALNAPSMLVGYRAARFLREEWTGGAG